MLLFISKYFDSVPIEFMFQYISCYSLSNCAAISPGCLIVSIHLMLLFIVAYQTCKRNRTCEILFQYISCYSLSEMHRVDRKLSRGFNTSHVTLYLRGGGSLWTFSVVSIHLMLLFIRLQDI